MLKSCVDKFECEKLTYDNKIIQRLHGCKRNAAILGCGESEAGERVHDLRGVAMVSGEKDGE
jgi:hypothetical protein